MISANDLDEHRKERLAKLPDEFQSIPVVIAAIHHYKFWNINDVLIGDLSELTALHKLATEKLNELYKTGFSDEEIYAVQVAIYYFELNALVGLGGCKYRPFEECLEKEGFGWDADTNSLTFQACKPLIAPDRPS